ncbi:SdrD B-like domain-containing protein [Desulfuromonas soudanensis]|uniref:SdrD B-like domain-containing protein n=1 Tax=Desulfuromonas soudanensis TaxID=1603606 RepID=UPI0006AD296D|nr:SdrD B-like domain-containing protein [Desulfuromonas soudanensis]
MVDNYDRDNDLTNLVITETLPAGMTYVAGSASVVAVSDGTPPIIVNENISGSTITWTLGGPLDSRRNFASSNWMYVDFEVYRSDEGLISSTANYQFSASLSYDAIDENTSLLFCQDTDGSGNQVLPLREPAPSVSKRGWNVDATQTEGQATTTVYGNNNDDMIWRLRFVNGGRAPLEDLIFDDTMVPGNMQINYVCTTAAAATAVANANGAGPGACYATYRDKDGVIRPVNNSIQDFAVDDPFGNPANDEPSTFIDAPANNGTTSIYLVGKLTADASCSVTRTNTLSNIEWGCEVDSPPDGGISQTSSGATGGFATTNLIGRYGVVNAALTVNRRLTGTNTGQPVGTRGTMTITTTNNTGGSVKFTDTLAYHLKDTLPVEYVVDPTYVPTINVTSPYGAYNGRVDTLAWTNPAPGTFPINTSDPISYLNNKAPEFKLSSSTSYTDGGTTYRDMMRQGDVLTITFGVVLIKSNDYDRNANLDVTPEEYPVSGTDPTYQTPLTNTLEVKFDTFCPTQGTQTLILTGNGTGNPTGTVIAANPEDLDIAIGGGVFILTNDPTQTLTLPVLVTNNGGHDARDYHVFATFGTTMDVVSAPAGCSLVHPPGTAPAVPDQWQPAPLNVWIKDALDPIAIPSTATVYECTSPATISPGQTVTYNFNVLKTTNPSRLILDDLTFRADVVGEITLSGGATPLWFPAPIARADGELDRANNYSLDAAWARVIGFNLKKSQLGTCNENNPPTLDTNGYEEVQIGEECAFHIETGGWFGFKTPGYAYIAVKNIDVVDQVPDGQAYIASSDPDVDSTPLITGIVRSPNPLNAVDEGWFDWRFNVADADRIEVADEWFRVDVTTRLLNKPVDSRAAPNVHAADSFNVMNSTFDAVFQNENSGAIETYTLGSGTIGYPNEPIRRVDLRVTEPNILMVKEVCNETMSASGTGAACTPWTTLATDGDAYSSYIYRITATNEASSSGVQRAPAYDLIVTDRLDPTDLAYVLPLAADGLDNDGDGLIDEAGEGAISDNVVKNSLPAILTFSYTDSSALRRIDPGASVALYYRVDYDDDAAPLQTFTNTVEATYDSLSGDFGNQSTPQRPNSDLGGARVYTSPSASAAVRIIPVAAQPKRIIALSQTPPAVGPATQGVTLGEEIEYQLNTLLPVALLRSFVIRDELPAGLTCAEAPVVDLGAAPYAAAGFVPGGTFTPTCADGLVEWNFGDQRVTNGTPGVPYDFAVKFIARVENTATTNDGDLLSNGDPATLTTARYIDEADNSVVLTFGQVDVQIREPLIELTKTFAVPAADAGDRVTVTVTATNRGTADAHNLRILDDLTNRNLTFLQGSVSGTDPPDAVDISTFGPNSPVFVWNPTRPVAPGQTLSFTFSVQVDAVVEPHEVLDNTLQGSWTSLPGQTTALNSAGLIGADGSATGMRTGALPNGGDAINDYETTAVAQMTVSALSLAKTDLTPAAIPAIGAHRSFQIDIALPEGVSTGVRITDSLDAAGLSYLLENNAAFDVSYVFEGIATINGLPPAEAAFIAFPADETTGSAVWDIGTVVTDAEDDSSLSAVNPLIRIVYFARVNNDLVTDSGDPLQNSVTLNYSNGETGASEALTEGTAAVTVVEPVLTATKTVRNVTAGKLPGDPAGGGDLLEYEITLANSGNATAFDVNLVDTLSAGQELYPAFTATAAIGGVAVSGFVAAPLNAPAGPLVWGRDNGDDSLDIPAGASLVLTYQAVVRELSSAFSNSVHADWTSLDGADPLERTGAGCPAWSAPNDYCAGPAVTATPTADDSSFAKSLLADSYDTPPLSTAVDAVARVGDTLTYRLALTLRGGLSRSVAVQDLLPAGMAFVETLSINGDAAADYAPPASGAGSNFVYAPIAAASLPAPGATGTLTWNLGDIVNDPFGDPTTETLEIIYRARILSDAGIPQVPSATLTNGAALSYAGSTPLADGAAATLRQPVIAAITKIDRSGRPSGTFVDVASDVMNFRLQACNASGEAPAYSVLITDTLAGQFDETSIAGPVNGAGRPDVVINGSAAVEGAGSDYLYSPAAARGGTLAFRLNTPVYPGECVTIDYDIAFHTDFGPNQIWANSATLDEYWSLPAQSGQLYAPVGPATFSLQNVATTVPPQKTIVSPASGEAAIGQEIVYRIAVPATVVNGALYDVAVTDILNDNLEFLGASEVSGNGFVLADNSTVANQLSLSLDLIPAGKQAVIEVRTRLRNLAGATSGVAFTNSATYTYAETPGGATLGGGSDTTAPIRIVEPLLSLAKTVDNVTAPGAPPQAGHILRYTLSFTAAGGIFGDDFADAFDLSVDDNLSLGLAYSGNAAVTGAGNSIGAPQQTGDGTTAPQHLLWSLESGTADIDLPEGTVVTLSYEVRVLDGVLANQLLSNSAVGRWTGLDGESAYERNGTETPAWNDYLTAPATTVLTVPDSTTLTKTRILDTFAAADAEVRIGDMVEYELRLGLQEGAHAGLVLTDTLPRGLAFAGIVSVNGDAAPPYAAAAPFVHADLDNSAIVVTGDPAAGPTTVTWTLGDVVNAADGSTVNDVFVIVYRARVLNAVHPHLAAMSLVNAVRLDYDTASGAAAPVTDDETIALLQPILAVAKSAVAAGGDTVLAADEVVTYTVDITNSGSAPAYDVVLEDIFPAGLRGGASGITVVGMQLTSGTVLPNLAPAYDAVTGVALWNFDTGAGSPYAIPAGDTLRIVYEVQAESALGAGLTLTNQARVPLYHSFDDEAAPTLGGVTGVREIYGPTNVATTTLTTATPGALDKENPALPEAAVGEPFSYRITVPAAPLPVALHDVRILDDLSASAADLSFVSVARVSGSLPWTPVNTGDATALVIEDPAGGIDIPAGEQIVLEITVVLSDTPVNVSGLLFSNSASYTYNSLANDPATRAPGAADTTGNMTIVGPDGLTLEKSGPATVQLGTPATFTLNVHNPGSGSAWTPTVTDLLPQGPSGGMCGGAPVNVSAQFFQADGVTAVSAALVPGTDFLVSFTAEPACQWSLTLLPAAGPLASDQRLIIGYDAALDPQTVNGSTLTNVAGVTRWQSADPAAAVGVVPRTYDRTLTNGTPGTLDHEDAQAVVTESPILVFTKSVANLTTGEVPGRNATPGDTLRYTLELTNAGPVGLSSLSIVDELDALNAVAAFSPGTLTLVSVPAGADITATSAAGGSKGTGQVDVRNLAIGPQGAANDTLVVEFDIRLAPVLASATTVLNQAELVTASPNTLSSDDPNVNGLDDPAILGDEDPTETLITSSPAFEVWKSSTVMTGGPALQAGETLRYTLTVKNVGTEDAVNATLRDFIPANTVYAAGSTTLNGTVVADPSPGVSPLQSGLPLNAPENATAGTLRADTAAGAANVATVTFAVVVDLSAMNGLIIENQGFLSAAGVGSGPLPQVPSDDPATAVLLDPTRNVVGNLPLLGAQKTVALQQDFGSAGIVDPGDVLRYTIVISNFGAIPATGVILTDTVPAHTVYVADSLRVNGAPLGADGGVSPLIAGLAVTSSDNPGAGIVSAGGSAEITFDLQVNAGVPTGTLISNQASVTSNELPAEPTDADGLPANGDQPTVVVVGDVQLLSVTKEVLVVGGGIAEAGGELEYVIRVSNIGSLPATAVVVTDDLAPLGSQVSYVAGSGTLNGAAAGVSFAGSVLTADYAAFYGDLAPGAGALVRFRVRIDPALAMGTTLGNTALVRWNTPAQSASASVSLDLGGTPGSASLNGRLWHDANLNGLDDGDEPLLAGWAVEIYRNNLRLATVLSDESGAYRFSGLVPNEGTTQPYEVRFLAPGAGPATASLGTAASPFTNGPQRISGILVPSGGNLQGLNLPISPNGAVYDSVQRTSVAGASLALLNAATGAPLPGLCFDDPAQQNQLTAQDGFYKFDLNFSDGSCPAGGAYLIQVTPPATGYLAAPSKIIPPTSDDSTAPFSVPACPGSAGDALPSPAGVCEATATPSVPPLSVPPRTVGTAYYLHLTLSDGAVPGQSQIFNNPIPLDPEMDAAVAITKTAALINVSRGGLVPYTIRVNNVFGVPLYDIGIVDRFPAGFKYVPGSARLDGAPLEPRISGRELLWDGLELQVGSARTIQLLLVVGAGVSEGEYVNRAQVISTAGGGIASGEATATVRVTPDATFDCTDVIGKVFDDRNLNGEQDAGEEGLAGVRVVTARGLIATTDEHGRFHITCAVVPDEDRGSNFILKLDDRTLPTGYRLTTENPRVQRATRGKALRFPFGATIHRVVTMDIADGVFEPEQTTLRLQWEPKVDHLIEELQKGPSVLRLSYLADVEPEGLVKKRLKALKKEIARRWKASEGGYRLDMEIEVFWRRGGPL